MNDGITQVYPNRVVPILLADSEQSGGHLGIGFLPGDLLPAVGGTPHGLPQPIWIMIQLLQSVRLRTDEATREWIFLVSAHRDDRVAFDLDRETTGSLTERTDSVNGMAIGHLSPPWLWT